MPKGKKQSKSKPSVKVQDISPRKDAQGGRFNKISLEYKEQKVDGALGGSVKLGYDFSKQKKI